MKKLFIVTGVIIFFGIPNLVSAGNDGKSSLELQNFLQKEGYREIIELLKKQIKASEEQIEKAVKIYQSITGDRTRDLALQKDDIQFFFQNPEELYPGPNFSYHQKDLVKIMNQQFRAFTEEVVAKEMRHVNWRNSQMRTIINDRIKYSGIVSKAASFQAFQDAGKRFTQIEKLLSEIKKTKDLKEVTKLQAHIKNMLTMIKNESIKLQMVAHLQNAEDALIDIQKRKLYGRFVNRNNTRTPSVRF